MKAAEEKRLERDEEQAYVLFMKYVMLLTEIRKFPDFNKEKNYINSLLGSNSVSFDRTEKVLKRFINLSKIRFRSKARSSTK